FRPHSRVFESNSSLHPLIPKEGPRQFKIRINTIIMALHKLKRGESPQYLKSGQQTSKVSKIGSSRLK
ncbi:hypothetical protein S83_004469, partial [Arachis hypogaea]